MDFFRDTYFIHRIPFDFEIISQKARVALKYGVVSFYGLVNFIG